MLLAGAFVFAVLPFTYLTVASRSLLVRIGRRAVIVTDLVVCSLAVVLISMAAARGALIAAVIAYAAGVAITTAATTAFITDVTRRPLRRCARHLRDDLRRW